jgi:hypothetical protein
MRRYLFVVSHLGCNGIKFYESIISHPIIQSCAHSTPRWCVDYDRPHPFHMTEQIHKFNGNNKIYADCLLFNYQLSNRSLLKTCDFVFYINNGVECISDITKSFTMNEHHAKLYYSYRLQRITHMMSRCEDPIVYIDGISSFDKFQDSFNKKFNLYPKIKIIQPESFKVKQGVPESAFDKYYAKILNMSKNKKINLA